MTSERITLVFVSTIGSLGITGNEWSTPVAPKSLITYIFYFDESRPVKVKMKAGKIPMPYSLYSRFRGDSYLYDNKIT